MKVFMLGWEFPPMISGGLGVACYGLAKALNARGIDVMFVLPKPRPAAGSNGSAPRARRVLQQMRHVPAATDQEVQQAVAQTAAHAAACEATDHAASAGIADEGPPSAISSAPTWQSTSPPPPDEFAFVPEGREVAEEIQTTENYEPGAPPHLRPPAPLHAATEQPATPPDPYLQHITFVPLDSPLRPYMTAPEYQRLVIQEFLDPGIPATHWSHRATHPGQPPNVAPPAPPSSAALHALPAPPPLSSAFFHDRPYIDQPDGSGALVGPANTQYAGDLFSETHRYARLALAVARDETFSVIHGHDWMTFEAAMAVAAASGRPLVLQIHSTELDRAGEQANRRIMEIERRGMLAADVVIAVSYKTKTQLIEKYGIDPRKIEVVYNATEPAAAPPAPAAGIPRKPQKRVLFLGRLTRQKGPAYFLQAAKKVLSMAPDVKFILAGKGDMEDELKELADDLGIRKRVLFAGFLQKEKAVKALEAADVYVMPSVSEPFGLAPLEALTQDVPVIISKQSGVAEVLQHVLKVDFWDTDDLANKILAVLRHAPLAQTLREQGQREVRQMSWDDSAERIVNVYERLARKA